MAWLFGSSKKSNKPEVFVSSEVEGGFNVVSTIQPSSGYAPIPPYPVSGVAAPQTGPGPGYPLYPSLPQRYPGTPYLAVCPQAPSGHKPAPVHPLDSIPFKLSTGLNSMSSTFTKKTLTDLESIRNGLDRLSAKLKSNEFTYSFELERSVIREERMSAAL